MIFNKLLNSHSFVFDLFLEKKIGPFYSSKISNLISSKKFSASQTFNSTIPQGEFLVRDIPDYLELETPSKPLHLKVKKVKQYKGYLVNLESFNNLEDYLNNKLSKRNKKNLASKKNKLCKNHNISSQFYFGDISKKEYKRVFDSFYVLLENRFNEKKTYNRYLLDWQNIKHSTFQKILDKKASLNVIYDNQKPIAITLNFHLCDIVFSHIQTYDINYSKYNMGDISMLNHLEWLLTNKIAVFDLSMGKTYYKEKWCNYEYSFLYHVFYKKNSLLSKIKVELIVQELKLLQFLRNKNIIGKLFMFDKFLYTYKNRLVK